MFATDWNQKWIDDLVLPQLFVDSGNLQIFWGSGGAMIFMEEYLEWLTEQGFSQRVCSDYLSRIRRVNRDLWDHGEVMLNERARKWHAATVKTGKDHPFASLIQQMDADLEFRAGVFGIGDTQSARNIKASLTSALRKYGEFCMLSCPPEDQEPVRLEKRMISRIKSGSLISSATAQQEIGQKILPLEVKGLAFSVKKVIASCLSRLKTQDRAYPVDKQWLFFSPRLFSNGEFIRAIGWHRNDFFEPTNKQIENTKFLLHTLEGKAPDVCLLRDITKIEIRFDEADRAFHYYAFRNKAPNACQLIMSKQAAGGLKPLYQEPRWMETLGSASLNHDVALKHSVTKSTRKGLKQLSRLIQECVDELTPSDQARVKKKHASRWPDLVRGPIVEKLRQKKHESPDQLKELADNLRQDVHAVIAESKLTVMQWRENSKLGARDGEEFM